MRRTRSNGPSPRRRRSRAGSAPAACGRVTSRARTPGVSRHTASSRWARVSMRSTGSPVTTAASRSASDPVVRGEREVVAGRVDDLQRRVDDEVLALAALVVEDAVKAAFAQPAQPDLSHGGQRSRTRPDRARFARPLRPAPHRRWRAPRGPGPPRRRGRPPAPWSRRSQRRGGRPAGDGRRHPASRARGTTCGWCRPAADGRAPARRSSEASSAQLCSAFLAKPMPGSRISASAAIPASWAACSRAGELGADLGHHVGVLGPLCMSKLGPRPCIRT